MKTLAALSTATILALASFTAAAAPTTTFLFAGSGDGAHLMAAVRNGVFTRLEQDSDAKGRALLRYRFGDSGEEETRLLRGLKVYAGGGGEYKVRGLKDDSTGSDSVLDLGNGEDIGPSLLASTPLCSAGDAPAATPAQLKAARTLVQAQLARLGIARRAWPEVLAAVQVQPVRIQAQAAPVLVISGTNDFPRADETGTDRVFGYLLVAEYKAGQWTPAFRRTYYGGQECGVTRWEYLDHADLDAGGTDELVIAAWGWENTLPGTVLRRAPDGRWGGTGAGDVPDGDHC